MANVTFTQLVEEAVKYGFQVIKGAPNCSSKKRYEIRWNAGESSFFPNTDKAWIALNERIDETQWVQPCQVEVVEPELPKKQTKTRTVQTTRTSKPKVEKSAEKPAKPAKEPKKPATRKGADPAKFWAKIEIVSNVVAKCRQEGDKKVFGRALEILQVHENPEFRVNSEMMVRMFDRIYFVATQDKRIESGLKAGTLPWNRVYKACEKDPYKDLQLVIDRVGL